MVATVSLGVWWRSLRAYSFSATIIPVVCATLAAHRRGGEGEWSLSVLLLMAALLLHAAVNILNDYYDYTLGFDTADSPVGSGLLVSGILPPQRALLWGRTYLALAVVAGAVPVWQCGWPILVAGVCGWLGAAFYSHGKGYKYRALGEVSVFTLMGVLLYASAYLVGGGKLEWPLLLLALPFAALVTAIMLINNLRDVTVDQRAGFTTLPLVIGKYCARVLYLTLITLPLILTPLYIWWGLLPLGTIIAPLIILLPVYLLARCVGVSVTESSALLKRPEQTALLYLLYGLAMIGGELWHR